MIFFLFPFVLTFYISLYFLNLLKNLSWVKFIISFVIVYIAVSLIAYVNIYILLPKIGIVIYKSKDLKQFLQNSILGYVQFYIYASFYFHLTESFRKEKLLSELRKEKLLIGKEYSKRAREFITSSKGIKVVKGSNMCF